MLILVWNGNWMKNFNYLKIIAIIINLHYIIIILKIYPIALSTRINSYTRFIFYVTSVSLYTIPVYIMSDNLTTIGFNLYLMISKKNKIKYPFNNLL